MRSFVELLALIVKDHKLARDVLGEATQCESAYPEPYAAIYLLGMLYGATYLPDHDRQMFVKNMAEGHAKFMKMKPSDYIGNTRVYARMHGQ
jgi:hypothetical protein